MTRGSYTPLLLKGLLILGVHLLGYVAMLILPGLALGVVWCGVCVVFQLFCIFCALCN